MGLQDCQDSSKKEKNIYIFLVKFQRFRFVKQLENIREYESNQAIVCFKMLLFLMLKPLKMA